MKQVENIQIENFKGFNKTINKNRLEDTEFQEIVNMVNYQGILQKRPGVKTVRTFTHYLRWNPDTFTAKVAFTEPIKMLRVLNSNLDNVSSKSLAIDPDGTGLIHECMLFFTTTGDGPSGPFMFVCPQPLNSITPDAYTIGYPDGHLHRIDPDTVVSTFSLSNILIKSDGTILFMANKAGVDGIYKLTRTSTIVGPNTYVHYDTTLVGAFTGVGVDTGKLSTANLIEHFGRIFAIGVSGNTIRWSDPGSNVISDAAAAVNVINLPSVPREIRSLDDSKILIFCDSGLYVLNTTGSPQNWLLNRLAIEYSHPSVNQEAGSSTVKISNGEVYFITQEGFFKTDGESIVQIDLPIRYIIEQLGLSSNVDADPLASLPANYLVLGYLAAFILEVGLFSSDRKEILIRLGGDYSVDYLTPPGDYSSFFIYLLYNADLNTWSLFDFSLNIPSAPGYPGSGIYSLGANNDGLIAGNMPYLLKDFVHYTHDYTIVPPTGLSSLATSLVATSIDSPAVGYTTKSYKHSGMFLMANGVVEGNILYFMSYDTILDIYSDGSNDTNNGAAYESKVVTKAYDFGFRGLFKKIVRMFTSISTDSATDIDMVLRGSPEDTAHLSPPDFPFTISGTKKNIVLPGPGYFIDHDFQIYDVNNKKRWELEALGFELVSKVNQEATTGKGR